MENFTYFLGGLTLGFSGAIYALDRIMARTARRMNEATDTAVKDLLKTVKPQSNNKFVTDKLLELRKITEEQMGLLSAAEAPSPNAVVSRYQNRCGSRIRDLDNEKLIIVKSILDSGHDPIVSTMSQDGQIKQVKLSEAFGMMNEALKEIDSMDIIKTKPRGKLSLVKNEETNNDTNAK